VRGELNLSSRESKVHPNETRSTVVSTTGGVMTEEVGAVTGELEVATRPLAAEDITVTVRYAGAEEWYTVEGSPIELGKASDLPPSKPRELHERVVRHLTTPGKVMDGNEQATSLLSLPSADSDG
jgi:hypothetical protein